MTAEPIDYEALDPGIRKTVKWLRERGFETADSGDGVTKAGAIADGDALDYPHVFISCFNEDIVSESCRLMRKLSELGCLCESIGPDNKPCIQATFDPADDSACIELRHVNDARLFP